MSSFLSQLKSIPMTAVAFYTGLCEIIYTRAIDIYSVVFILGVVLIHAIQNFVAERERTNNEILRRLEQSEKDIIDLRTELSKTNLILGATRLQPPKAPMGAFGGHPQG